MEPIVHKKVTDTRIGALEEITAVKKKTNDAQPPSVAPAGAAHHPNHSDTDPLLFLIGCFWNWLAMSFFALDRAFESFYLDIGMCCMF